MFCNTDTALILYRYRWRYCNRENLKKNCGAYMYADLLFLFPYRVALVTHASVCKDHYVGGVLLILSEKLTTFFIRGIFFSFPTDGHQRSQVLYTGTVQYYLHTVQYLYSTVPTVLYIQYSTVQYCTYLQ
jgi:hypothetical protein